MSVISFAKAGFALCLLALPAQARDWHDFTSREPSLKQSGHWEWDWDGGDRLDVHAPAIVHYLPTGPARLVINGPDDLRKALVARSDLFVQTVTGQLMSYAIGRPLEPYDMPVVRRIARDVANDNNRFSSIILHVVESDAFRKRQPPPAEGSQPGVKSASLAAPTTNSIGGK